VPRPAEGYTLVWQVSPAERSWIREIFGDYVRDEVADTHTLAIDNSVVIDARIYRAPSDYYPRFATKRNVFLFHLSDEWYDPKYQDYSYFNGVFRNYASAAFNPSSVMSLPLGYYSSQPRFKDIPAATDRKYVWCFLGQAEKSSRPELIKAFRPIQPSFIYATDQPQTLPFSVDAYHQSLLESIFVPCPMGNVNLESYRVYESLECGAIPLLESRATLDYFRLTLGDHPLPTFRSWNAAARFVRGLIAQPAGLLAKQEQCVNWWHQYKRELKGNVGEFMRSRADGPKVGADAARGYQRVPGWQAFELLRHHSTPAILRRIAKEGRRLVQRGPAQH
jgi:hypothetical protein